MTRIWSEKIKINSSNIEPNSPSPNHRVWHHGPGREMGLRELDTSSRRKKGCEGCLWTSGHFESLHPASEHFADWNFRELSQTAATSAQCTPRPSALLPLLLPVPSGGTLAQLLLMACCAVSPDHQAAVRLPTLRHANTRPCCARARIHLTLGARSSFSRCLPPRGGCGDEAGLIVHVLFRQPFLVCAHTPPSRALAA